VLLPERQVLEVFHVPAPPVAVVLSPLASQKRLVCAEAEETAIIELPAMARKWRSVAFGFTGR
jgi:hypothetical protein